MDRFSRGLVAGLAGGVSMNIWSLISYHVLHIADRRYLDWASVLLFGHLPINITQTVYAQITQLIWSGFLGVVFAYLIPAVTSRGYILKGAVWGFVTGFVLYSIAILIRMPYFAKIETGTSISQFIGGLIWGTILAYTLRLMDSTPKIR